MKKAFNLYINSSLHVALAVVAFTVITNLNFDIPVDYFLLLFIFLGTITGYNFIKYAGIAQFYHFTLTNNLKLIQIFSLVCLIGLISTIPFQSVLVLITAGILGIFTLLYALPFPGRGNLRGVPGLKIYITAFVVAGVTVVLPLLDTNSFPNLDQIIEFLQRCIIAVVLILPFEIRDVNRDTARLRTIPQKLGISLTKKVGYVLTLIFCLIEFLKNNISKSYALSLIFLGIMCVFFLKRSSVDQDEYFASFWVEAVPMLWLGVFYLTIIFT